MAVNASAKTPTGLNAAYKSMDYGPPGTRAGNAHNQAKRPTSLSPSPIPLEARAPHHPVPDKGPPSPQAPRFSRFGTNAGRTSEPYANLLLLASVRTPSTASAAFRTQTALGALIPAGNASLQSSLPPRLRPTDDSCEMEIEVRDSPRVFFPRFEDEERGRRIWMEGPTDANLHVSVFCTYCIIQRHTKGHSFSVAGQA